LRNNKSKEFMGQEEIKLEMDEMDEISSSVELDDEDDEQNKDDIG